MTSSPAPFPGEAFRRLDEGPDEAFYREARFVTHIDEAAIAAVTDLYRRHFPPGGAILDLMSSWVSHLPPEIEYARVVGVGMNAEELAENPFLDEWYVQNLNREPRLPFADATFDGAAICVSIQYLVRPVEVLREVGRVLRPTAPLVITYSDRCFATKAIACWRLLDDVGHLRLIGCYLAEAGNWDNIACCNPDQGCRRPPAGDPLYAVIARRVGWSGEETVA
ncbi:MAG TPA: methyltransferase domain-containing protein [Stellaceae bacterium]|jgi:SAM-dependent methyltransferase|nr:methyltransferase domain-containing protein [Stellaceae bacterium]